jgi:hypothetical protein
VRAHCPRESMMGPMGGEAGGPIGGVRGAEGEGPLSKGVKSSHLSEGVDEGCEFGQLAELSLDGFDRGPTIMLPQAVS